VDSNESVAGVLNARASSALGRKDVSDRFAAASDARFVEYRLKMLLDGGLRYRQLSRDPGRRDTAQDVLTIARPRRLCDDRRQRPQFFVGFRGVSNRDC